MGRNFWRRRSEGYTVGFEKHEPRSMAITRGQSKKTWAFRGLLAMPLTENPVLPTMIAERNAEDDNLGGCYSLASFVKTQGRMLAQTTALIEQDPTMGSMVDFACNCCHRCRMVPNMEGYHFWHLSTDPTYEADYEWGPVLDGPSTEAGAESPEFFLAFRHFESREIGVVLSSRSFADVCEVFDAIGGQEWYFHYFATRKEAETWLAVMPLVSPARE